MAQLYDLNVLGYYVEIFPGKHPKKLNIQNKIMNTFIYLDILCKLSPKLIYCFPKAKN